MTKSTIPLWDVKLYNRCPVCDQGPGQHCIAMDGHELTTTVHPERVQVRAWAKPKEMA